ncbi:hypothetical protein FRC08_018838 [Ceratobasidium sp. 394]|nr:hypothetical protein FRC08_018838 [Ceratobasidium sp. 394]
MDLTPSNPAAHICDLRRSGTPILPFGLLRSKFARCVDYLRSRVRKSKALITTEHARLVSNMGLVYYTRGRLVTRSDCSKHKILRVLATAETHILECMAHIGIEPAHCDIVVDVYCVSSESPRYNYYIADHEARTVLWLCPGYPELPNREQTRVRNTAEYWRHRATFPNHHGCTRAELQEAQQLLNEIKMGNLAQVFAHDQLDTLIRALDSFGRTEGDLEVEATFSIARINQVVAERSIPQYHSHPSSHGDIGRPGLLGTLFGIWLTPKPRHPYNPDVQSPHQSQHSGSPRSSVHAASQTRVGPGPPSPRPESVKSAQPRRLGVTSQSSSSRDSAASGSSEYLTPLSGSVNDLDPPPKIQSKSASYSPIRSSPLTRNVEVLTDAVSESAQENEGLIV